MPSLLRFFTLALLAASATAVTVDLRPPLTAEAVLARDLAPGAHEVEAVVVVPDGAPKDLGVAAYAAGDGGWSEHVLRGSLTPGRHRMRLRVGDAAGAGRQRAGLRFWSASVVPISIQVLESAVEAAGPDPQPSRLCDLRIDGLEPGGGRTVCVACEPWSVSVRCSGPDPRWRLRLEREDGSEQTTIAAVRDADGSWRATLHPLPGRWRASIVTDAGTWPLPPLEARGDDRISAWRPLRLAAPLDTVVPLAVPTSACELAIDAFVPDDAPADLAAGFVLAAADGRALPAPPSQRLVPGLAHLRFRSASLCDAARVSLVLWSSSPSAAQLRCGRCRSVVDRSMPRRGLHALLDAELPTSGPLDLGQPWTMSARPYPAGAIVEGAAGSSMRSGALRILPAGDRIVALCHPAGAGQWRMSLDARWPDGDRILFDAAHLTVRGDEGPSWCEVPLRAPLGTEFALPKGRLDAFAAEFLVGDDAPADLALAAFVRDDHGRWWVRDLGALPPGLKRVSVDLLRDRFHGPDHEGEWSLAQAALVGGGGLVISTARPTTAKVLMRSFAPVAPAPPSTERPRLQELRIVSGASGLRAGERFEVEALPTPMPANPYDPGEFALDLVIERNGAPAITVPGFWRQPFRARDGGDRELLTPSGGGRFAARFRPQQPGTYRLRLQACWRGAARLSCDLPPLRVDGPAWDGFVRVDADHRYFSANGQWFWPLGPNLRSVWDERCRDRCGTRLTPARGTLAYDAYLARLSAAGANAAEIWLSSWNLALEWRGDWAPFHGVGRYSDENAWRIERVLDEAQAHGMRVNLVVNNHGQASDWCDAEWSNNPWNAARGGPLGQAGQLFTDPLARAGQERMRRYLIARYADHPALLAWKLWSEMDLTTAARTGGLQAWHEQATAHWRTLDPYAHPVTTHWCTDYTHVDARIAALPSLSFVCCDAYHGPGTSPMPLLADLMEATARRDALGRFGKPILVTEFGGNWDAAPEPQLLADHLSGPWAALVTGHGGAPMLWWFEWIDQKRRWEPYRGLSRFLAGEDARGGSAQPVSCDAARWWARAWSAHGHVLGYLLDRTWGMGGRRKTEARLHATYAGSLPRGQVRIEWWDPESGELRESSTVDAGGGSLDLSPPPFSGHIAFKIR